MPERSRFLAEAGVMLAGSRDIRETLQALVHTVVPAFADWCAIVLLDEAGAVHRVAGIHADPSRAEAMAAYLRAVPPDASRTPRLLDSARNGTTVYLPKITAEVIAAAGIDPVHRAHLEQLGLTASIVVPLVAREVPLGALSLCLADDRRVFDEDDLALAQELGALAGLALDSERRLLAERGARERAERAEAEASRLLAEREDLLARAESASRTKDEFLAILGHELRNPLAPIVTALELMKLRGGAPGRELAVIERQTHHLVRLIDDLLDVSRIARGRVHLDRRRVEVRAVVDKAIEMAELLLDQGRHRLTVEVPAELAIDGDPTRLAQVVSNLLTNAAKYTPPGGLINVSAVRFGSDVAVRVRDSGVGIAPAMLDHVFDMFVQARQSLDRARGGLGLGLTIVKSLVEAHGGRVAVRSSGLGQGSEFEVRLPLATGDVLEERPAAERPVPTGSAVGRRVLVVDDNADAATLLSEALATAGFAIRTAHDAGQAIEIARAFRPEAAILDIGLPVVDGYELARQLRTLPGCERVSLIALTGYGQSSDRERAFEAGFDRHLVKPINTVKVQEMLEATLHASRGGQPVATRSTSSSD